MTISPGRGSLCCRISTRLSRQQMRAIAPRPRRPPKAAEASHPSAGQDRSNLRSTIPNPALRQARLPVPQAFAQSALSGVARTPKSLAMDLVRESWRRTGSAGSPKSRRGLETHPGFVAVHAWSSRGCALLLRNDVTFLSQFESRRVAVGVAERCNLLQSQYETGISVSYPPMRRLRVQPSCSQALQFLCMLLIIDRLPPYLSVTTPAERRPLTWHSHCNFYYWSFVCPGRGSA